MELKLNAEMIKKVLEHCSNWTVDTGCKGCPYDGDCIEQDVLKDALALITSQEQRIKQLTEENERLRAEADKRKLWENVLKAEVQEVPIKAERIRVADAITDEIYRRYRQRECFDKGGVWNCDKFKALLEDIRAKYIPEENWEDRDC